MNQSCKTCRWAVWRKITPTGKIARGHYGICHYPVVALPKLPASTVNPNLNNRTAIWPKDGTSCPCYERGVIKP